jgi:hypothetical protein
MYNKSGLVEGLSVEAVARDGSSTFAASVRLLQVEIIQNDMRLFQH